MKTPTAPKVVVHSGDVTEQLKDFLDSCSATIFAPEQFEDALGITHVFVNGDEDFNAVRGLYGTVEKKIALVALSNVDDLTAFIANGGRLVIDQTWLNTAIGKVNLEKFFLGRASVHLSDNFPSVKEGASCKITNHLRMGADLDRLSAFVHAHDGAVVNVRTFVDHALYYFFYLKQAGIGGVPIEVDYGHTGQDLVVQIHLSVKNYVSEYLLDSFGKPTGHTPLRYLLSICARSADFMEVQYIEGASKLVISGLWQDQRSLTFGSLLINHVMTASQQGGTLSDGIEIQTVDADSIEALGEKPLPDPLSIVSPAQIAAEKERVREELKQDEGFQKIKQDAFVETFAQKVAGSLDKEAISQLVKGSLPEAEEETVVGGGSDEDESAVKVSGGKDEEEIAQRISGTIEAEIASQVIKGEKIKPDDFVMRIGQSVEAQDKGAWKVKSGLGQPAASDKIRGRLNSFAANLGQAMDELTVRDLQVFAQKELPSILTEVLQEANPPKGQEEKFKSAFQANMKTRLESLLPGTSQAEVVNIITPEEQEKLVLAVMKETIKQAPAQVEAAALMVKGLGVGEEVAELSLKAASVESKRLEDSHVLKALSATGSGGADQAALMARLRTLESEHLQAKSMLETAQTEIRILKESRDQMMSIERRARETASVVPAIKPEDIMTVDQKMEMMQEMISGKVDATVAEKMRAVLEREQKIIQGAKTVDGELRKFKIEMQQKGVFFNQELEKANRAIKTRDMVVQKAKDGLALIVAKKDNEISEMRTRISALVASQDSAQQAGMVQKIKGLEQEKQSLNRLVEVYKNKLTSMATNMEKQASASNPKKDEDMRKVAMEKQRLEVNLQTALKDLAKVKSKVELDQSEILRLRSDKVRLEESLRQAMSNSGPSNSAANARSEAQAAKIRELQQELTQQSQKTTKFENQAKDLEQKVLELTASLAKAPTTQVDNSAAKSKVTQMESSVKKLSADLAAATNQLGDAKKEINKLRSENTALKNLADKAKKDAEKAAKSKPGAADKKAS